VTAIEGRTGSSFSGEAGGCVHTLRSCCGEPAGSPVPCAVVDGLLDAQARPLRRAAVVADDAKTWMVLAKERNAFAFAFAANVYLRLNVVLTTARSVRRERSRHAAGLIPSYDRVASTTLRVRHPRRPPADRGGRRLPR
jgi:hypothetical protein